MCGSLRFSSCKYRQRALATIVATQDGGFLAAIVMLTTAVNSTKAGFPQATMVLRVPPHKHTAQQDFTVRVVLPTQQRVPLVPTHQVVPHRAQPVQPRRTVSLVARTPAAVVFIPTMEAVGGLAAISALLVTPVAVVPPLRLLLQVPTQ